MQGTHRSSLAALRKSMYCGGPKARHCHPHSLPSPCLPSHVPRTGVSQRAGTTDAACHDMGRACLLTCLRPAPDLAVPTHADRCSGTSLAGVQLPQACCVCSQEAVSTHSSSGSLRARGAAPWALELCLADSHLAGCARLRWRRCGWMAAGCAQAALQPARQLS